MSNAENKDFNWLQSKITWNPKYFSAKPPPPPGSVFFCITKPIAGSNAKISSWSIEVKIINSNAKNNKADALIRFLFEDSPNARDLNGKSIYILDGPKIIGTVIFL